MLKSLSVENFAVTKKAHLDFGQGFCALTGETGAGKSMLVDALTAALGSRAESAWVREGCSRATVSAVFEAGDGAKAWLLSHGIDCEDGEVSLRRLVEAGGRSKAWINGVSVSAAELREVGSLLAAIHGQHESVALLGAKSQRDHLDAFAKNSSLLSAVGELHAAWQEAKRSALEAKAQAEGLQREKSQLAWEIDELVKIGPKEGEWERLGELHSRLAQAVDIQEACEAAINELVEDDGAICSRLGKMAKQLGNLPDPALREVAAALAQASEIVSDASRDLGRFREGGMDSDMDVRAIDERLGAFHEAARKLRIGAEELPRKLADSQQRMALLDKGLDVAKLEAQEAAALLALAKECAKLTASREAAAGKLGKAASANLAKLGMGRAAIVVKMEPMAPGVDGADLIEFAMAGHEGAKPLPLSKCASGGELARLGLALCAASVEQDQPGCMVFDEVDAGIGGPTATKVGQMLGALGARGQTLAVTHLPQVAAQAVAHYAVGKGDGPDGPQSIVRFVAGEERVVEIARMLGDGSSNSAAEHARELLGSRISASPMATGAPL